MPVPLAASELPSSIAYRRRQSRGRRARRNVAEANCRCSWWARPAAGNRPRAISRVARPHAAAWQWPRQQFGAARSGVHGGARPEKGRDSVAFPAHRLYPHPSVHKGKHHDAFFLDGRACGHGAFCFAGAGRCAIRGPGRRAGMPWVGLDQFRDRLGSRVYLHFQRRRRAGRALPRRRAEGWPRPRGDRGIGAGMGGVRTDARHRSRRSRGKLRRSDRRRRGRCRANANVLARLSPSCSTR